jgi:hypothetical protein
MIKPIHVAMLAALTVSVAALAQTASNAGGQATPAAPAPEKKASSRLLRGEIETVDLEAKSLTVKVVKAGEATKVETDASTQFIVNGKAATLADIRRGMSVTILPDVGTATKVTAKTAKQPPKRTTGSTTNPTNP